MGAVAVNLIGLLVSLVAAIWAQPSSAQPISFTTCASQLRNHRVSDVRSANEIVTAFADQLHKGQAQLPNAESGHFLFCRDDNSVWHHVTAPGIQAQQAMATRVADVMSRVDEGARILQVDSDLASSLAKRGLGRAPSVVSVGRFKWPMVAMHYPSNNVLAIDVNGEGLRDADVLVHEAVGHLLFYMSCTAPKDYACKANPATFVWKLFTEADAFAKQIAYATFMRLVEEKAIAQNSVAIRGFDRTRYMQVAEDLLRDRSDLAAEMRRERKVPKAFTALLLEQFSYRPPAYYFEDAINKQRPFGTRRDIEGSLESIVGYLDDDHRKRISATFRASSLYKALGDQTKMEAEKVRSFMKAASQ